MKMKKIYPEEIAEKIFTKKPFNQLHLSKKCSNENKCRKVRSDLIKEMIKQYNKKLIEITNTQKMKPKAIEKLDFVKDCLRAADKKENKKIMAYLLKLDKSINKELAKDIINLPPGLTQVALMGFLQEKAK